MTPRNVLIDDEGAVRLIDFGIAAPVTRASDTARTEVFGSPGHMPPEQLHGAELTPATDVFAVGVLLIEAWTGYPPFRRATAQESEQALFVVPPPIDRQQPLLGPLSALIASSVALDARERPIAAEHLARPLREFLKSEDSGDIARRLGERVRRARRRSRSASPWLPGESATGKNSRKYPACQQRAARPRESAAGSAPATRTFAAREEVEVWTRRLSSAPAGPADLPATPAMPGARQLNADKAPSSERRRRARALGDLLQQSQPRAEARRRRLAARCGVAGLRGGGICLCAAPECAQGRSSTPGRDRRRRRRRQVASAAQHRARGSAKCAQRRASAASATRSRTRCTPTLRRPQRRRRRPRAPSRNSSVCSRSPPTRARRSRSAARTFNKLGQSPIVGLKVPVGRYQVVFRNDTFGAPLTAQVMILAA